MADNKTTEQYSDASPERGMRMFVWFGIVLFVAAGVAMLLMPQVGSHSSPKRDRCRQNLKNIGLAIDTYSVKYGSLPAAYTVDKQGHRMHSWRVEFWSSGS